MRIGVVLWSAVLLCSVPNLAHAATLTVQTANPQVGQDQTFIVEVRVDSEREVINAVQARLTYDPHALEIVGLEKAGSVLSLWPEEPKSDPATGVITFAGGIPNGSYVIDGRVLQVIFRAKKLGTTQLSIDGGTAGVYLNDGLGTKAALRLRSLYVDVVVTADTLGITSPSHPNEHQWYAISTVRMQWQAAKETPYAFLLTTDRNAVPDVQQARFVGETTFPSQADGAYYFTIQEKLPNDTWGALVRRRVLIDTTQPEPFTPQLRRDVIPGKLALVFQAEDRTSGIERYEVQEGDGAFQPAASPYQVSDVHQRFTLTVRAYDQAGNVRVAFIPAASAAGVPQWVWIGGGAVIALTLLGAAWWVQRKKR
ncbi:MAG: cohesin domain-containing protein [Patescibacteria group bacterium]